MLKEKNALKDYRLLIDISFEIHKFHLWKLRVYKDENLCYGDHSWSQQKRNNFI